MSSKSQQVPSERVHARLAATHRGECLQTAFRAAYISAFGRNALRQIGVESRIRYWMRHFGRHGDRVLIHIKTYLARLRVKVLEDEDLEPSELGFFIPKSLRNALHGHRRVTKLLQFLKLSRALPPVVEDQILNECVDEYINTVTEKLPPRPVPYKVRSVLMRTLRELKVPELPDPDLIGCAGCLGATRKQGGRSSLVPIPEGWDESSLQRATSDYKTRMGIPVMVKIGSGFVKAANRDCQKRFDSKRGNIPSSQVLPVPELGAKIRIVTKNDHDLVALGHAYRKAYFPLLKKKEWPTVSEPLVDPDLMKIRFTRSGRVRKVFSADFSKATDKLSHEAIGLVCDVLDIDHEVVYKGHSVHDKTCTTGAFMGLPFSWTCLSMIHYAVCAAVDPYRHDFRIKGDDLISLWTEKQISQYKRLASAVGLIVNDKSSESSSYGTFCENDYVLKGRILIRLPTFSLRSWVRGDLIDYGRLASLMARGVKRKIFLRLQGLIMGPWRYLSKRYRVEKYTPRLLGGLGFLAPKPNSKLSPLGARAMKLAHDGKLSVDVTFDRWQQGILNMGTLVDVISTRSLSIKWTCSAPERNFDLESQVEERVSMALSRAAFSDAALRCLRSAPRPSRTATTKRLRKILRHTLRTDTQGSPMNITIEEAHRKLSMLTPTEESVRRVLFTRPARDYLRAVPSKI